MKDPKEQSILLARALSKHPEILVAACAPGYKGQQDIAIRLLADAIEMAIRTCLDDFPGNSLASGT